MTRRLEIVFYGLACFDERGEGYRVLFPDGRTPGPFNIPLHEFVVLEDNQPPHAITTASELAITGLNNTQPDKSELVDRLPNLKMSDPDFVLDNNPETIVEMTIDRGTLSAFQDGADASIIVLWIVEAEDNAAIVFSFDADVIQIAPNTKRVVLSNASANGGSGPDSDFNLYRKLATVKDLSIRPTKPMKEPIPGKPLPPFAQGITIACPFIDCSAAFSH